LSAFPLLFIIPNLSDTSPKCTIALTRLMPGHRRSCDF